MKTGVSTRGRGKNLQHKFISISRAIAAKQKYAAVIFSCLFVFLVVMPSGAWGDPLTVSKAGTGTGTVTSSPSGINCGSTCSTTANNTYTLTATPISGASFTGWSGSYTTSGISCRV